MSIRRGSLITLFFKVFALGFGLGVTVATARLGSEERGVFALSLLAISAFNLLFGGLGLAITHRLSRWQESPRLWLSEALIFGASIGTVGSLLLWLFSLFNPAPWAQTLAYLGVVLPFVLVVPYINGMYLGQGNMFLLNFTSLLPNANLLILFSSYWLFDNFNLATALFSLILSHMVAAMMTLYVAREYLALPRNFRNLPNLFKFSAQVGLTNLTSLLNYKIDLILVEWFLGLQAVGIYSIAVALAELLWFISSAVGTAAYSRIGESAAQDATRLVLRIVQLNLALLLLAVPVLLFGAYWGLPWIFGAEYRAAFMPLVVLVLGVWIYGAASSISAYFTNHLGKVGLSALITSLSFCINLGISWYLIPEMGMLGAAFGTTLSYSLSMLVLMLLFWQYSGVNYADLRIDFHQLRKDLSFKKV